MGRISYLHPKMKRNAENDAVEVINLLCEVIEKWKGEILYKYLCEYTKET